MSIKGFYHSPASIAFVGKELQVAVALTGAEAENVLTQPLQLRAALDKNRLEINMSLNEKIEFDGNTAHVFSATIPQSFVSHEGFLDYSVYSGSSLRATASLAVKKISELPSLIITETYTRSKGLNATVFVELTNISDIDIDLYDYKMVIVNGHRLVSDMILGTIFFADSPGKMIIQSKQTAACRLLTPEVHNPENAGYIGAKGFCDACKSQYTYEDLDISPENITVFDVEICEQAAGGKWQLRDEACLFPTTKDKYSVLLAKRDAAPENATFILKCNGVANQWDNPVKHSSLWGIAFENPAIARNISHRSRLTPGYLDSNQAVPDFDDVLPPVIIPNEKLTHAYYKDGDLHIRYAVVDKTVTDTKLIFSDSLSNWKEVPAQVSDEAGVYEAVVPHDKLLRLKQFRYFLTASDSIREVSLGSEAYPLSIDLYDNEGPVIVSMTPQNKYCYETAINSDSNSEIHIFGEYYDISGVNVKKCIMCLNKKNITSSVKWSSNGFSCKLPSLKCGAYKLELALFDNLGNHSYIVKQFTVTDGKKLNCYHGEVHCHTSDSDGSGYLENAMIYARDVGKSDFFAVTDHSHYISDEMYDRQVEAAEKFNAPGKFVSLYGWEMTWNNKNGYWGHMNVLNTKWIEHEIDSVSLPELYSRLEKDKNAVAIFNHPGYAWGNFDEYEYRTPIADKRMCLTEIKGAGYDREYANMLSKGWHASPSYNEDNHLPDWTTATSSTTYVLAPSLTRENILEAMRKRRTYSTSDSTMKIYYKVNGAWLGSTLDSPERLDIEVTVTTENDMGIGKIMLVTEDNIVVNSINVGMKKSFVWKTVTMPDFDYYYIKIVSKGQYTVTAPVWINGRNLINISELELGMSVNVDKPNAMRVGVNNASCFTAENVRIDFYLTDVNGFELNNTQPYYTEYIGKIKAKHSADIKTTLPSEIGYRRVSAVVRGFIKQGCKTKLYSDTAFTLLRPAVIASVMPESSEYVTAEGIKIDNPFPYITLYNTTHNEFPLDGYQLRLWTKTGKMPLEGKVQALDGMKIKPRSSIVIWQRTDNSKLTVSEFNQRYGTDLIENEDIYAVKGKIVSNASEGRRIDLLGKGEVLSRVHYNYGLDVISGDVVTDSEIMFKFTPTITGTSKIFAEGIEVKPGTVHDEQKPQIMYSSAVGRNQHMMLHRFKKQEQKIIAEQNKSSGKFMTDKQGGMLKKIGFVATGVAITAGAAFIAVKAGRSSDAKKEEAKSTARDIIKLTSACATAAALFPAAAGKEGQIKKLPEKKKKKKTSHIALSKSDKKTITSQIKEKIKDKSLPANTPVTPNAPITPNTPQSFAEIKNRKKNKTKKSEKSK